MANEGGINIHIRRGVQVSLPYFIPAPIWLGTFGAFIIAPDRGRKLLAAAMLVLLLAIVLPVPGVG